MGDMLQETNYREIAEAIGELLSEHKGEDVSVMDLRGINNWTDFFIIVTVTSKTHMDGLERHIKDFCREREIDILRNSPRNAKRYGSSSAASEDEWRLIDLGPAIIHLMNKRAREFYELERLWAPIPA